MSNGPHSETKFEIKKKTLIAYMHTKIEEGDWHAVSDCANDLRVLEARCEHKFLVQNGVRVSDVIIDGKKFVEVGLT